jgi:hypothetical protein
MSRPPFPFVVGSGRSGTTLLRVMLDAHPGLAVAPEAFFPLEPRAVWERPDGSLDAGRAAAGLAGQSWFADWELPPGAFASAVADGSPSEYADVIRCLFETYARAQGKSRFGSKTPQHVLSIGRLAAMFPEARFVHLVRDGRDVAASFMDVHFGPSDLASAAQLWRHRVRRGRAAGANLQGRYLECRYEELIADPEDQLRAICAFLELDYDDAMLRYHERDPAEVAGVGDRYYHRHVAEPPTQRLRDWRTAMSRSDVLLFESIAGDQLDAFGYDRAAFDPSRTDRIRLRGRRAAAEGRRRIRSLRRIRGGLARRVRHV